MIGMAPRLRIACLLLALAGVTACGKVNARTPGPSPALAVPTTEPRMVIPVSVEAPPPAAPAEPPGAPAAEIRDQAPPKPRPTGIAQTTTPPATPPTEPPPQPPAVQTRTNVTEIERDARGLLDQAERGLRGVDRQTLSSDTRAQFDNAERFIRMAMGALEVRNFVYAYYCADKAATLARLLVKRAP